MTVVADNISDPEGKLARLMETVTGLKLDPAKLKEFVTGHWRALQTYAHAIHEDDIARRAIDAFIAEQKKTGKLHAPIPSAGGQYKGED